MSSCSVMHMAIEETEAGIYFLAFSIAGISLSDITLS